MASLDDLKNVLRETLEQKGTLNKVKAEIRAEIFTALDADNTQGKPPVPQENILINELIREYLEYNRYYNAASVLMTETGQPNEPPFDREFLHRKFGVSSQARGARPGMPLLYELVYGLKPELAQGNSAAGNSHADHGNDTFNQRE